MRSMRFAKGKYFTNVKKGKVMNKIKKIILSLSIAIAMCVALVVGAISTPQPTVMGGGC